MSVQCQGVITRFYIQLFFIIISWNVFEYYRNQLFFQRVKRLLTIKYLTSEKMKKLINLEISISIYLHISTDTDIILKCNIFILVIS